MKSVSVEDYLKAIYHLSKDVNGNIATSDIAKKLHVRASSTTEMLSKLESKQLVSRKKYYGVNLTEEGSQIAIMLVRKHRLWEVFLSEILNFKWEEVHELAEQLEHIDSDELINRLDNFLGNPKFDPHGDPIPDAAGNFILRQTFVLSEVKKGAQVSILRVRKSSKEFLEYLSKTKLVIGIHLLIQEKMPFDNSLKILINNREISISEKVADNLLVKLLK